MCHTETLIMGGGIERCNFQLKEQELEVKRRVTLTLLKPAVNT